VAKDRSLHHETPFAVHRLFFAVGMALLLAGCGGNANVESDASTETAIESGSTDATSNAQESDDETPGAPEFSTVADAASAPATVPDAAPASVAAKPATAEAVVAKPTPTNNSIVETRSETADTSQPVTETSTTKVAKSAHDAAGSLEEQLAAFTIPPAWLDTIQPKWSTAKPWKEGRKEIRRLLGQGDDQSRREGIKLTWEYFQKNDIGDGHEYGMYMFLGNEPLWAVHVYREWLTKDDHAYPPYFGVKALASLYTTYGLFEEAERVLEASRKFASPDPKWNEVRAAELNDAFGDLYAAWGKIDQAKTSYQEAVRLFPLGKPPYGRHLLPRKAKKVQAKLDLLSKASLDGATLRDGRYNETALGYSGDVQLAIEIKGGKLAGVHVVKHEEKIDQNACKLIPRRISAAKSLHVDGISGATVTKDAIVSGTLNALKKAGLR